MFNNFTESEIAYESCSVVQPSTPSLGALLIGDFNSVTDLQKIKLHNIKTIITAATNMEHLQIPANIEHITYPLLDANSENIRRFFDESTTTIKNSLKNGGVLVHCAAGISRSATLVIAYIMKTRKICFKEAIASVRIYRNVRPNLGFQRQLKQYQKQILDSSENKLNLKKTITQKMSEQRRTSYNRSSHLNRMFMDYLKFEPRTADQSVRKKNEIVRRIPYPYSQSRQRDKKNFKVRPLVKQGFFVLGQAHGVKQESISQNIGISEQIKPPIIRHHHKNALNNGWIKFSVKKNY